eukprot:CAMPEP_0169267920 /NCGR_PEP_ID=MMETSP1016-20121227/47453_1 /TAXON_ID=342587 /ORGANISM="Karlodinium micrum, Strain CCMP2283" /LENGTH=156 /DNA_ID=CAMNT_0009352455 /DNA_START=123 /DNA_END=589 /DNA_ORIENTATION=-
MSSSPAATEYEGALHLKLRSKSPDARSISTEPGELRESTPLPQTRSSCVKGIPVDSPAFAEIRGWIQQIKAIPAVAAGADQASWRRHLDEVRAGCAGTAACLSLPSITSTPSSSSIRSSVHMTSTEDAECSICLQRVPIGVGRQLACGHTFHVNCL